MLKQFMALLRADLLVLARSKVSMFWTLAFPALMLVLQMALFGGGGSLGPVDLYIVDHDQTQASKDYATFIAAAAGAQRSIKVNVLPGVLPSASKRGVALTIPSGFGSRLAVGATTRVDMHVSIANASLKSAMLGLMRGVSTAYEFEQRGQPPRVSLAVQEASGGAPANSYVQYLTTGLAGMILLSTALMGFAPGLVAARNAGTLHFYQVLPVPKVIVLLAWCTSRLILCFLATAAMFVFAGVLYGFRISGGPGEVMSALLILFCTIAAFLSVGVAVAAIADSAGGAAVIGNLLYFPLLFTGDLMIPLGGLPGWATSALAYSPLNASVDAWRALFAGREATGATVYAIGSLVVLTAVCIAFAGKRFSWSPRS